MYVLRLADAPDLGDTAVELDGLLVETLGFSFLVVVPHTNPNGKVTACDFVNLIRS